MTAGNHPNELGTFAAGCGSGRQKEALMNSVIYLIGLVVVVLAILSFLGLS